MALEAKTRRKKKKPEYKSFRLRERIKPSKVKKLPSSWRLWKDSLKFLRKNWKKIGLFLLVYMTLYLVFVRGLGSAVDFNNVKESISGNGQSADGLFKSVIFFGLLIGSSNAVSSDIAAAYQSVLFIIGSLAFIWLIRALYSNKSKSVRVRDSFYLGMQPFVTVIIVLSVIALQTIPMSAGGYLLSMGLSTPGISLFEVSIFIILAALISLVSLYLISGTWAAIYIVTLPGAEPWKSIKASNKLLSVHRWQVMRKLLALAMFLFLSAAILIIPLLIVLPDGYEYIAEYGFFAYLVLSFSIAHTYLYSLYKSLL